MCRLVGVIRRFVVSFVCCLLFGDYCRVLRVVCCVMLDVECLMLAVRSVLIGVVSVVCCLLYELVVCCVLLSGVAGW